MGGKHVIFNLMQALINPGDEVIIPVPYWVTYKDVVNYAGGKCVFVRDRRGSKGFALTAAMIGAVHHPAHQDRDHQLAVEPQRRGDVRSEEFEKIYKLCVRARHLPDDRRMLLHFLYDGEPFSIASLPGAKENVLVAGYRSRRRTR